MKISEVIGLITNIAGAFFPAVASLEELIGMLMHHDRPEVRALGSYTASLTAANPDDPVTVEEVEAALALLNPPLEPDDGMDDPVDWEEDEEDA